MKLPNGFGSVYKLSGNRRKPWVARVTTGFSFEDEKPTQKYHYIGYFEKRPDAMNALVAYNSGLSNHDRSHIKLKTLYNEWYNQQEDIVGESSLEGYRTAWKHFEKLSNKKVSEIKKSHIQSIIDSLKDSYSKSAMTKVKMLMSMLMDYAMADDIIDKNYAKLVRIPKKAEKKKESFTDTEIKKLFDNDADEWVQSILILIYTGMRIAELLSLTKFNIDFKQNVITGGLKTDAGRNRTIPIHPRIQPYIKRLYDKSEVSLFNLSGSTVKLQTDNYRRRCYYPALDKVGICRENHSPHACRYTFALMLEKNGVNQLQAQKLLGHADYATTANIYTNPDIELLRSAINKIV